jgi:ankyrin repeat protein
MSRPLLDTQYELDGDPTDTRDAMEGPPGGRRWASRFLAFLLAAASIYGAVRGFHRYSATSEEVSELTAIAAAPAATKLPSRDDLGGIDPQTVVTTWTNQNAQRLAADKLHLWSAYGQMLLCPAGLFFAIMVWWRGQFKRPEGSAVLDGTQIGVALTSLVALAAVRGFDAYSQMSLDKMAPAMDLKTAFHQTRDARKPERFTILKDKLDQYAARVKDRKEKPAVRVDAAKRYNAIVTRKEFLEICPEAAKAPIVATLKELIKANYADETICPLLIKSVGATGAVADMAAMAADREKSKPAWIDPRSPAALKCLYAAVTGGDEAAVRQLIQRGVGLNVVVPGEGHTALHQAVALKNLKLTRLLLDGKARPDVQGRWGVARVREFPLHRAVSNGDPQMAKLLLERGANPNAPDDGGLTPLHRAAAAGDVQCASALLQAKAQPNRTDKGGRTPHDVASQLCSADKKPAITALLERNNGLPAARMPNPSAPSRSGSVASTPRE